MRIFNKLRRHKTKAALLNKLPVKYHYIHCLAIICLLLEGAYCLAFLEGKSFGPIAAISTSHLDRPKFTSVYEIVHSDFIPGFLPDKIHTTGYFWLKVDLKNSSPNIEKAVLLFHLVNANRIEMFDDLGNLIGEQGNMVSAKDRSLPVRMSAFIIDMKSFEQKAIFFRLHKHKSVPFTFLLVPYDWFVFSALEIDNILSGLFYGLSLLALLSIGMLFLRFREKILLQYLFFLIISIIGTLALDGHLDLWFDIARNSFGGEGFLASLVPLIPLTTLFYVANFAKLQQLWVRVIKITACAIAICLILGPLLPLARHTVWLRLLRGTFSNSCFLMAIIFSVYASLKGFAPRYFMFGTLIYCIFSLWNMGTWGNLPFIATIPFSPIYNHLMQAGSCFEFIIFAIALFRRAKEMEIERETLLQQHAEQERKHAFDKAIAKNVQMIAHDLRKPLQALKIYNKIISTKGKLSPDFPPKIDAMIDYAEGMTANLLAAGTHANLKLEAINLLEIADFINESLSKIKLTITIAHKTPLIADRIQLTRVLRNLVHNAEEMIKSTDRIWLISQDVLGKVEIVVGNTGTFIEPDVRQNLFEEFTTRDKVDGIGLGLAIAKRVIESHGGSIYCRSEREFGTEFVITLPTKLMLT